MVPGHAALENIQGVRIGRWSYIHPPSHQYCTQATISLQRMYYQNTIFKKKVVWKYLYCSECSRHEKHVPHDSCLNRNTANSESVVCEASCSSFKVWFLGWQKLSLTTCNYLCKYNCRFQHLVLFFLLLLYFAVSLGFLCYCYLYSNEYMQVTCLHTVRLFPPYPALPSMQFSKLQKHGAGSRIKHSSQMSTES